MTAIATDIWRPDPDRPGQSLHIRQRTLTEVYDDLRAYFGEYPVGGEEYFEIMLGVTGSSSWPRGGRVVVFSVNGSSEGDYTHVEHHDAAGSRTMLLLGKTFMGRDASWAFARRLADLLEV